MKILGIETSCDETAVSLVEGGGKISRPQFKILSHLVSSQVKIHAPFGGVVPSLAKREHGKNLIPLLRQALTEAKLLHEDPNKTHLTIEAAAQVKAILEREPELLDQFLQFVPTSQPPKIKALAVTVGPGLEPALWVGINLAKALGLVWQKPVVPINHLEGHLVSVLINEKGKAQSAKLPALALLISGGHSELVLVKEWLNYRVLGRTLDDAAGEAFDKVARILGLPYPGGPAIAQLAQSAKTANRESRTYSLPRPMLHSSDFNFSFAGLKTAVLYLVRKIEPLTTITKSEIAAEFQQAVIDVLLAKTLKAVKKYKPKTVIVGGGVAANQELQRQFQEASKNLPVLFPPPLLTGDNATMIAMAAYLHLLKKSFKQLTNARGNLKLA